MKRLVWTFTDGSVAYEPVDPGFRFPSESEDEQIERLKANSHHFPNPNGLDLKLRSPEEIAAAGAQQFSGLIEEDAYAALQANRWCREAWTWSGVTPGVNMPKAVAMKQHELRRLRDPLLVASDVEFMRAVETDDKAAQQAIAQKKQALRDVTDDPAIAAAKTPEELKAVMPSILSTPDR